MSRNPTPLVVALALALAGCGGEADDAGARKTRGILGDPTDTAGLAAPPEALALVAEGSDLAAWRNERPPAQPVRWRFERGVLTIAPGSGSLVTAASFEDLRLHLEFRLPTQGVGDGNSGVYIQRRYELQILAPDADARPDARCGAIYRLRPPDRAAGGRPGEWQCLDLVFRAPRWQGETKVENARLTAHLNGQLIHDDVPIPSKTGAGREESPDAAPLKLQDHGAAISFRNTWLVPLELD